MASLKIAPPAPKKENIKDYQPSSTIAIPVSKVQLLQEVELLIKDDLAAFFSSEGAALELPAGEPYGSPTTLPKSVPPAPNSGGVLRSPQTLGDRGRFQPLWCACLRARTGRLQAYADFSSGYDCFPKPIFMVYLTAYEHGWL